MILQNIKRSFRHHPTTQTTTLFVLTATFFVIASFFCVQKNLQHVFEVWGESVQYTVYLRDMISPEALKKIRQKLESSNQFESINFVEKSEAAKKFKIEMGLYSAGLLSDADFGNPLPASFETKLKPNQSVQSLTSALTQMDGVDEVSYGQGWIENYLTFIKTFARASNFLMALLLVASLFIVSFSIRSAISQRRDEIEILELVGATSRMIKAPFLAEGAFIGSAASLFAILFCYGFYHWQLQFFEDSIALWKLNLQFLSLFQSMGFIGLGGFFGWLSAYFCVQTQASGWAAAERSTS